MNFTKFVPYEAKDFLKNVQDVVFLKEGWRGKIFRGVFEGKNVAIKIARYPELSKNIRKEGEILKLVNSRNIGPNLLIFGYDFVVMEFIEGKHLKDFLRRTLESDDDRRNLLFLSDILKKLLFQARALDELKISKNEMHRPYSNVIVAVDRPVLIDFESTVTTERPKNVTQLFSFVISYLKNFLTSNRAIEESIELMKRYKESYLLSDFQNLVCLFEKTFQEILSGKFTR